VVPKRRDFLRLADEIGTGGVFTEYRSELDRSFAHAVDGPARVIWLHGASDSGCTLSLIQGAHPYVMEALIRFRKAVDFYPTLMVPSSDRALLSVSHALAGRTPLDLLVVEGAAPAKILCASGSDPSRLVPFETWVTDLAKAARRILAVGRCAARAVSRIIEGAAVQTIPGCPASPDEILLTLATALADQTPHVGEAAGRRVLFHEPFRPLVRGGEPLDN